MPDPSTSFPLTERPATEADYKPISGVAIAALIVSALTALIILVLASVALYLRKPLLQTWIIFPAAIGFVLAIAARLHIQRSEGTRTGLRLAALAWWLAILSGAGYAAYLQANKIALQNQSEKYALEWFTLLEEQKSSDPQTRDAQFYEAFLRTETPGRRTGLNSASKEQMEGEFGNDRLPSFRSSRLMRLFQRNGKEMQIVPQGVATWEQTPTGYQIDQWFRLRSAEGVYDLVLHLFASEGRDFDGRQWHIILGGQDGGLTPRSTTGYGHALMALEQEGRAFASSWLNQWAGRQRDSAYLLTLPPEERPATAIQTPRIILRPGVFLTGSVGTFFPPFLGDKDEVSSKVLLQYQTRSLMGGSALALLQQDSMVFDALRGRSFFRLESNLPLTQADTAQFRAIWRLGLAFRADETRAPSPETTPQIIVSVDEVRVTLPIVLVLPSPGAPMSFARLTIRSTNAALLKELQELYTQGKTALEANQERNDSPEATELLMQRTTREWQVVSIETNLRALPAAGPSGGPGGR